MKPTEPTYFAIEINTGAVNGFYKHEVDAIETTKLLAERYKGSKWTVSKTMGDIGAKERAYSGRFYSQDAAMKMTLSSIFSNSNIK